MQISNQSWHYRFNMFIQREKFTHRVRRGCFTTCSYIRTCLFSVLQALWALAVGLLIGALVCWIVGSAVVVPILIFFFSGSPGELYVAPAVMAWMAIAAALAIIFIKMMRERLKKTFKPNKEPNVFFQAIKDHHNKFCTRVEVV